MTRYLRPPVAIWWAASVILILVAAIWVNGGFGFLQRSALASGLVLLALMGSALFAVVVLRVPSVQRWALREGITSMEATRSFQFVAVFTGAFGVGILFDMLRFI
jgi:hypothetical protein